MCIISICPRTFPFSVKIKYWYLKQLFELSTLFKIIAAICILTISLCLIESGEGYKRIIFCFIFATVFFIPFVLSQHEMAFFFLRANKKRAPGQNPKWLTFSLKTALYCHYLLFCCLFLNFCVWLYSSVASEAISFIYFNFKLICDYEIAKWVLLLLLFWFLLLLLLLLLKWAVIALFNLHVIRNP